MYARVCVRVCMFLCPSNAIILIHSSYTEWPQINGSSFVLISFSDLLTIPTPLLVVFLFFIFFICFCYFSLYPLSHILHFVFLLQQHIFPLPVCLVSHLFLLKRDRAHNSDRFCCSCNSALFISSLYLCHSSNFQSIYTVRMSLFFRLLLLLLLLFKMCVCWCAFIVCFRLNSVCGERKILYDRILCCVCIVIQQNQTD